LFDSGKAELKPRGYEAIQKAATAIRRRYPDSVIVIAGHTDNQKLATGAKFKDNQELSLARAKAVMNYLVQNGMDSSKLSVVGYGETKPIASNSTKEGMAKNRRVELVVSGVMDVMATDLIDEGMIMFKQGNYREALERFLKALESDSRNAKAYHLAGDCYLRLGGKEQAYEAYRKSLKFNPGDTALQQWMDQYGPKTAPAPAAPVSNTAPAPQPGATPQADQGAVAPETQSSSQPQTTQPATAPTPSTGSEPASQTAPPGVPQPVEAN
jgi:tetratricopeptide (TPR) repeat protein